MLAFARNLRGFSWDITGATDEQAMMMACPKPFWHQSFTRESRS